MIMGVSEFERLFREAASLDVDKDDLKRLNDFINRKVYDLLLIAQANAKANGRDIILSHDLPITRGLQESMHAFRKMEITLELEPILKELATLPMLDLGYGVDVEEALPELVGTLTVCLAKTFKVIDPEVKNPQTTHWDRAEAIFNMLL